MDRMKIKGEARCTILFGASGAAYRCVAEKAISQSILLGWTLEEAIGRNYQG